MRAMDLRVKRPMRRRVLLIGGTGLVGRALRRELVRKEIPHFAPNRALLDLTSSRDIARWVGRGVTDVINAAAWTDVDGAEREYARAYAVNATGVERLALRCRREGLTLCHLSTNYVFDGSASRPYEPDAELSPINAYGVSKADGERALCGSGVAYLIVRTSWVHGPWKLGFVQRVAKCALSNNVVVTGNDSASPTQTRTLARRLLALILLDARGIHHLTDRGSVSRLGFAREIVSQINPSSTIAYEEADMALRPLNGALDCSGSDALLGKPPLWSRGVARTLRAWRRGACTSS